jgi:hypothetical protein
LTAEGRQSWDFERDGLPDPNSFPILSDAWIDLLTANRIEYIPDELDMESSDDEIYKWADEIFNDGDNPCPRMQKSTEQQRRKILDDASSHDKITGSHWHLYSLGAEGHTGWKSAVDELQKFWVQEIIDREIQKRTGEEMSGEIYRSRLGALRKIKIKVEQTRGIGAIYTPPECLCSPAYQYPGPEALAEWNRNMAASLKPAAAGDNGLVEDEEWFWDSRPWLRDLRQFARSRRVGPWGLLGCVLVRILSAVPPEVVLPALVGSFASVNTFVAICGDPATSKSALMKAAEDFLHIAGVDVPTYNPGSVEAIPKSFALREPLVPAKAATKTLPAQPAIPAHQVGLAWSVVFAIPEIETLLAQKNGNQIFAALRSAWSGEDFSKRYAGDAHNIVVKPHRARCNVVIGVQWDFGEFFFDAAGAGTPQRMLYFPSRDTEQIQVKPAAPSPYVLGIWPNDDGTNPTQLECDTRNLWLLDHLDKKQDRFTVFQVPAVTEEEVDNHAMQRSGPEELDNTDPLDGHLFLAREKIAVAFAVMDAAFTGFSAEHWKLAGVVIEKNKQTREILYQKVEKGKTRTRNTKARLAGISRHKEELAFNEQQERDIERVAKFIYNKLDKSEWSSKTDIKSTMSGRDKAFFDSAIEELGERIDVEERLNARGRMAGYYRRAGG